MPYLIKLIRYGCLKWGIVRFRDPVFRYRCIRARISPSNYILLSQVGWAHAVRAHAKQIRNVTVGKKALPTLPGFVLGGPTLPATYP